MSTSLKFDLNTCVVCKIQRDTKKEWRFVNSSHGIKKNLAGLLLKYGEIDVVEGAICRPCERKLFTIDKSVCDFKSKCQSYVNVKRCGSDENVPFCKRLNDINSIKQSETESTHATSTRQPLLDISNLNVCTPIRPKGGLSNTCTSPSNSSFPSSNCHVSKQLFPDISCTNVGFEHTYSASTKNKTSTGHGKSNRNTVKLDPETPTIKHLKKCISEERYIDDLSVEELSLIMSVLPLRSRSELVKTILNLNTFKTIITYQLMQTLSGNNELLSNRKRGKLSVLNQKSYQNMIEFNWDEIVAEMCVELPVLSQTIISFLLPDSLSYKSKIEKLQPLIPRIGFIYSILAQGRNPELSKVQHIVNTILFDNLCDQKVFDRLQPLGACMSYCHSLTILDKYAGHFNAAVIDSLKSNKRVRIVGDNINWMTKVHDERKDNQSHMNHAFGSACIIQHASFDFLSTVKPQMDYRTAPVDIFLPSQRDWELIRDEYSVHILAVVSRHIPFFKEFSKPFENFFHGPMSKEVAFKNKVVPMPVLHLKEQKYNDVVKILDFYENFLSESFTKAGLDYNENVKVLIGGDRLTRERFSGSKCLRAGGLTPEERFDHLSPITFELFHMCMNYVKLIMKQLFNDTSINEIGTMKCEANRLLRKNVNINVNEHYESQRI